MDQPRKWRTAPDPIEAEEAPSIAGVRRDLGRVGLGRLLITALLVLAAVLLARFSWGIPLIVDAERALYDGRALAAALYRPALPDPRIVMVTYNPGTLEATGRRSPLDRAILARALTAIDRMGAKAIGIDILIDQKQPEDEQLIAAMKAMKTPVWLAYSTNSANSFDIEQWQQDFMDDFARRLAGSNVHRASIRLQADPDNVMRNWPELIPGSQPFLPVAMAGAVGRFAGYTGSVQFRQPADPERKVIDNLPIDLFGSPEAAAMMADQVRGKYVFIGGDIPDLDQFDTPATRITNATTIGLEVHATLLAQLLDGRLPERLGALSLWVLAILVVASGAFTAMLDVRQWVLGLAVIGQFAFYGLTPFWLEIIGVDTQGLPAFGWVAGWVLAFTASGAAVRALGSDQRRFAQSALGKYLPRDIAAQIMRDPDKLSLRGEKREIFTLFTDLEGFTKLSHAIPAERLSQLLNRYLDGLSDVVLDHGGTIDKFVGDAVVAFWGAPISRPDDADRAVDAALGMYLFGEKFAASGGDDIPRLGCTRVGLHHGEAIVGNFGGEGRIQYTALGDAMNTASRLESANKALKTIALVSDEAKRRSNRDWFRPMGRIVLSGRATPVVVWEPAPDMATGLRTELVELWQRFDGGDLAALDRLAEISRADETDAALAGFVYRLRESGPGGRFELREK